MDPVHAHVGMDPNAPASQPSNEVDPIQSDEVDDEDIEPLQHFHKLPWLRWTMGQQPDFKAEVNIVQQLALDRGYLLWFSPKFHCEINWAELCWCNSKTFARTKVDGKLGTMHKYCLVGATTR